MSPPSLPPRPPRPRRLTMAPSPCPRPGTSASKRRLEFLTATATPPLVAAPAERPVQVIGPIRNLLRGESETGGDQARTSCGLGSKRRRAGAGGVGTERPVEVIGLIRTLTAGASPLEVLGGGTTVRVRGGSCIRDFTLDGVSVSEEDGLEGFYGRFVRPRVEGVRAGAKCTVMVYGPTGSGKSHTMFGSAQPGIVYRALRDIPEGGHGGGGGGEDVRVSVLEIYNEEVYDLLAVSGRANANGNNPNPKTKVRLEVMGTRARNTTYISGNEAGKISREVAKVEKRRAVKSTHCNVWSSRSHCMIIYDVPSVGGRLTLVDMAGSENIEAAGQTGAEAKSETGSINQGNTTLKRVVESIANGDSHVPFRDSKLTMLLRYQRATLLIYFPPDTDNSEVICFFMDFQDSFEDERSKILMILCASPGPKELHKTTSTLEYGARAKYITRVACASTPRDKMSSNEAHIRLKDEELAQPRMKVGLMEAREAEISAKVAAKEEEIILKLAEETRIQMGELRMMIERVLMQQQEFLAVKQRPQEVEREKQDMEEESHLAWRPRVLTKLTVFLQNLGWRWTVHEQSV